MKIKQIVCALLLAFGLTANAANTVTKVTQVTDSVALTDNVDYVITDAAPFAGEGKVNIVNTEHAVLIIQSIRPSLVIKNHLKGRVFINGEQAVNGQNCQVKMYAHGAIIMPYAKDFKPLTVYSEPNFEGTAVNNFGLEHSGGFMNTLSEAKLNNQIRSFKLKRGYMVTFAVGKNGWGYSRCFIADKEDLEFATLPAHLDGRISSYRVFQWYDAEKKGLASDTRAGANDWLATSWCYDWAAGLNRLPDHECVPHQIYVAWPSASACGSATYACHMKTNNEPGNSADDTPQSVEVILNQWQDLMRTGLRLCSESSHDGSWSHLDQFIAEVDKRGWRCDILDLHCYWASGFDNMKHYYDKYGKRPIWISEFVWGASWNNNGIFATDRSFSQANQQKNLDAMKGIFNSLNSSPYVERYAYWNSEADCSKLLRGESELSLTGKYFQTMQSGMAYRKEYEKIPTVVYTAPTNLTGEWSSQSEGAYRLRWTDTNGDMLREVRLQRKGEDDMRFETVASVPMKDQMGKTISYSFVDTIAGSGVFEYRVVNVDHNDRELISPTTVKAARSNIEGATGIQYGELLMVAAEKATMSYTEPFASTPALFMGALSNNNGKLHLGNLISSSGTKNFTYEPLPWVTSTSTEFEEIERIPFMALEEGSHRFDNLDCEVGEVRVTMVDTVDVVFANPFPEGVVPVVLTEVRKPTLKDNPIIVKIRNVTNTGFKCITMFEDQVDKKSPLGFNVCYMAITPGVGTVDDAKGLMIAAGCNEAGAYSTTARGNYFKYGDDTLRFVKPLIFANLQTSNYDAATMVRRQSDLTDEIDGVSYTVGTRFRRVTDSSRKNAPDGTKLNATSMKDDLGWVVLYTRTEGTSKPTSIEQVGVADATIRPYAVDGTIYVDGCDNFDVYTMHGVKLDSHTALAPGVYVVKAASSTAMVVVK